MRLAVLGATGRTGRQVVKLALERGHSARCLVRSPDVSMPIGADVVVGDATDERILAALFEKGGAVLSCLGQTSAADLGVLEASACAVMAVLRPGGPRYLVLSQGLLWPTPNPLILALRVLLRRHVNDSRAMEARVASSGVEWTIVRAPRLSSAPAQGYRVTPGHRPDGLSLSRRDLATCLLDMVQNGSHLQRIVGVGPA